LDWRRLYPVVDDRYRFRTDKKGRRTGLRRQKHASLRFADGSRRSGVVRGGGWNCLGSDRATTSPRIGETRYRLRSKDRYCIRNSNSTDLEDLEASWTNSGLLFEARKIATSRVAVDDLTRAVGDWPVR
jgi:hypothetical protein